jgi:hypothetical protein
VLTGSSNGNRILRLDGTYMTLNNVATRREYLYHIKVLYLPTDAQYRCFKRILKFTLKQLLHVSVQSQPSGGVLFEVDKVIVIKIIS